MIKKRLEKYIEEALKTDSDKVALFQEELSYAKEHDLIPEGVEVTLKTSDDLFDDAYIERTEKDTVALILVETPKLFEDKINHLKKYPREFIYVEAASLDVIGVDAISLELDDVFGTYSAMLGLKLQKKYEEAMKAYLETNLTGDEGKYSIAFSMKDGLWDFNFALSYADGFNEDMTILEALQLVYRFIFALVNEVGESE